MNTLTKEDIEFIDNYLENSGIIYNDVRIEMVDHIATGVEMQIKTGDDRSFYAVFKDYMVDNKNTILNDHKIFIKATDKRVLKTLFKQLFSIKGGLFFIIIGLTLYFGLNQLDVQSFNGLVSNIQASLLLGLVVMAVVVRMRNIIRYSALDRLWFIFIISFCFVFNVFNLKYSAGFSDAYTSFYLIGKSTFLMLPILFLMTAVKFKKDYELKFKNIS
jgi:hypothetical protein